MTQPSPLTASQRRTLVALMDTFVPALKRRDDPHGYYATPASATPARAAVEQMILERPAQERQGLELLLDKLAFFQKFQRAPLKVRESVLSALARNPDAERGIRGLRDIVLMTTYTALDEQGGNPYWRQFGYAGLTFKGGSAERELTVTVPQQGETLHADVVVVGSGAGGGVIAGELAAQGVRVVVLDMGRHFADAELGRSEAWAYRNLYWRGGFTTTDDGNVSLIAGQAVGGGTVGNWMNCVRPPPEVRQEWAKAGLSGVDTAAFDDDLNAVMRRIQANNECSDLNGTHQRLIEGAMHLGYSYKVAYRNVDPLLHDPNHAGHCGFGDPTGSKQSTAKTYLKDAQAHGAVLIEGAKAKRILVSDGKASGVEAQYLTQKGAARPFKVMAPNVVVAGGALETPALLLRSGLGGPAVGNYLRLHPCGALTAVFDHDQQNWWGATQGAIVDEFQGRTDGYGFLIETIQFTTGLAAAATPWQGAVEHKERTAQLGRTATLIHLTRDRGHGRVTLREDGEARIQYSVTDPVDMQNYYAGQAAVARVLAAAGAHTIYSTTPSAEPWRRGENLDETLADWAKIPLGAGGHSVFSAHQMGSARLGLDPQTSVAQPSGELHDVQGVWIGDTSAFPTSSGANPMITVMALARRTARFIAQRVTAIRSLPQDLQPSKGQVDF